MCSRCHLDTYRDPALLAAELSLGALNMFRDHRKYVLSCLGFGWAYIYEDLNGDSAPLSKWKKAVEPELLDGLDWDELRKTGVVVDDAQFPELRRRVHRYRELIYREADSDTRAAVLKGWFRFWVEDYDLLESLYHWLGQQIARLERDPELVLNYVLERDPYRV
jgi:hypothetical protein